MCLRVHFVIIVQVITQEGLGISTPNLVLWTGLRIPQKPIVLDPLGTRSSGSNSSKGTWRINSKLGVWTSLRIPRSLLFLDPLGTRSSGSNTVAQKGLGVSTPNLVCGLVLGSPRSLLFLDPLGSSGGNNSKGTLHSDSNIGFWTGLRIPQKPIVFGSTR